MSRLQLGAGHDVAALHKDHTAGYLAGKADLMGDDDHRHAVRRQLFHNLQNLADHLRVQRRGRLVKQHDVGVHRQRTGNPHTLLLSAG